MNQVLAAGTYYPPTDAFTGKSDSLFGVAVGTSFESHAGAFASLAEQGFEIRPARVTGEVQQFALARRATGEKTSSALYALYNRDGQLEAISLAFAGEPCGNPAEAFASAQKVRAFVCSIMGREAILLDRIDAWSRGSMRTYMPEAAFAAAWTSATADCVSVADSDEFEAAAAALVGPTMTVIVTNGLEGVTALLTLRSQAAE